MKDRARNLTLLCVSVGISIIIFEIGARLFTPFPFKGEMANTVPHDKLGYTASPKLPGIDRHGFRNAENQDEASVVVLGDSHTYGFNVASHNTWPNELARKTGLTVYNYGMGGYGILHYVFLFDEAIKKRPEHIILGFYVANDLQDYCALATLPYWQKILGRANLNFDICISERESNKMRETSTFKFMRTIKSTVKRTAVGTAFDYYIWDKLGDLFDWGEDKGKEFIGIEIERGNNKTYISYERLIRHSNTMDPKNGKISGAIKASDYFFRQMIEKAREHNIKFSVLFIPSKERVFFELVKSGNGRMDEEYELLYRTLVRREEALVRRFRKFFSSHKVDAVDARAYMREGLKNGRPVYPQEDEGHPLELGYKLYADAALVLLQRKGGRR